MGRFQVFRVKMRGSVVSTPSLAAAECGTLRNCEITCRELVTLKKAQQGVCSWLVLNCSQSN